ERSGAQAGAPNLLPNSPWAAELPAGPRRTTIPKVVSVSVRRAGHLAEPAGAQPGAAGRLAEQSGAQPGPAELTAEPSACELIWV
ncbi:MAG TPA: hypothetical protein VIJ46_02580, partial [Rhabdochlamydiaceae bacterium]